VEAVDGVMRWALTENDKIEIVRILRETITDAVGPEFMAPPARKTS
jgi:hypothetical protein